MRISMVNWFWLLPLIVVACCIQHNQGIQVYPAPAVATHNNATAAQRHKANGTLLAEDSELSASERNRRLIPYMAFYLPAPEYPINQQYAIQKQQQQHKQTIGTAGASTTHNGNAGNPRIPLPTAYVHMKVPAAATGPEYHHHHQQPHHQHQHLRAQQTHAHFPPSGGDVYQTIAYGGQHPITAQQQHNKQTHSQPLHQLSGATGSGLPGTNTQHEVIAGNSHRNGNNGRYKPINKQKTVQHFPPLSAAELQQQQQQQQQQQYAPQLPGTTYRQRPKQSKHNLSPFTPANTVPGHFIPIVFTPTSNEHASSSNNNNGNNINYNDEHEHQQQQQHHNNNNPAIEYNAGAQQPETHIQYFEVTVAPSPPSAPGAPPPPAPTTSTLYHHIHNEPLQQQQPQQEYHSHRLHKQTRPHLHLRPTPNYEHFLISENDEQQQLQQQQQQQHLMSPQEKYVMYLHQQRAHYNQQQQQQQQHEQLEDYANQLQQQETPAQQQQQPAHIFLVSSTAAPASHDATAHTHPSQQPPLEVAGKFPQHSPIRHAAYARPELIIPANHQPHEKPIQQQQHVIKIPVQTMVNHVDKLVQQQFYAHQIDGMDGPTKKQQGRHKYFKNVRPLSYTDYAIEEPKQTLEEEQHALQQQQQQLQEQINGYHYKPQQQYQYEETYEQANPEEPAYIVISTPAPPQPSRAPQQQILNQEHFITTARPIYHRQQQQQRKQPTKLVQLQPIRHNAADERRQHEHEQYSTSRPVIKKPITLAPTAPTYTQLAHANATPKYIYGVTPATATPTPTTIAITPMPTAAIKLKPSYKYMQQQQQQQQMHAAQMELIAHEQYKPQQQQQNMQQQYESDLKATPPHPQSQHYYQQQQQQTAPTLASNAHANVANQLPDIRTSSLTEILHKLQESNHLPQTLTPDNIDNSIRTLITILNNLKNTQTILLPSSAVEMDALTPPPPPPPATAPELSPLPPTTTKESGPLIDYDYGSGADGSMHNADEHAIAAVKPVAGPNTGRPGIDYPNYAAIPQTSFDCNEQRYKGFFGDPETNCQVWHYCDLNGGKASFLCPNGTIFSQIALTCDWWFNVKCSTTAQLYVLNERLYKYILPFTPKFPEDYSGPLVDKYLAMKFQEMEEKMRLQKEHKKVPSEEEHADNHIDETPTLNASNEDVADDLALTELPPVQTTPHSIVVSSTPKHLISVNSQVREESPERNQLIDDEIDDIEQRGSIDNNYESTTIKQKSDHGHEQHVSFNLKPIIVTSTAATLADDASDIVSHTVDGVVGVDVDVNDDEDDDDIVLNVHEHINKLQNARGTEKSTATNATTTTTTHRDIPKMYVSVEKVEVIEIKPDGISGHLLPDILFKDDNTKKKR